LLASAVLCMGMSSTGTSWAANTQATIYRLHDYANGNVLSILPPGENGLVNGSDLLKYEATGARPSGNQDQLSMYANLLYGAKTLTNSTLKNFFNEESFGVRPEDIARIEKPKPSVPVTIYRDKHDVPHIYGDSLQAMAYGAGYAAAEDRLFLMDTLRHYGSGTLSEFLGPSCSNEQSDHDQLLLTGYTTEEKQQQLDALPKRYGQLGSKLKAMVYSYVDGINEYIAEAMKNPNMMPADYTVVGHPPQPWHATDIIDIASLVGGIFGKGGGSEIANAALLQYLQKQLGPSQGLQAFQNLKEQNDPDAPTTIVDKRFPYELPGKIDRNLTAIPDNAAAPLHGGPTATTPGCSHSVPSSPNVTSILKMLGSGLKFPLAMSNALVVDGKHSTSGHPIAVFGPQVGYFAPQILMEEDLHAPGYDAAGAAFPGTNFIIELGRGQDYAWSATSAGTDNTDQRLERICNPAGGTPDPEGKYYMYKGSCLPMKHHTFTETAVPKPGGNGAPTVIKHDVYYTIHGVVQGWTTADGGKPVAVVNQRSTYGHELDSGVGFLRWGMPDLTYDAQSWMIGASQIQYTFNWFYVDNKDIAYYSSGLLPVRPSSVDPNLPTWGTGSAEWQGFLPFDQHPHEINPAQGYFISWNNKPAPGFSAADDNFGFGLTFRSQMLDSALHRQLVAHKGKLTRANVVQAMEDAATVDLAGEKVLPDLLAYTGSIQDPGVKAMLDSLRQWMNDGSHRVKAQPMDSQYDHPAAVAIMDQLFPNLVEAIFDPILGKGGVTSYDGLPSNYTVFPQMDFVDTPNAHGSHHGSAYLGGWEGNVLKVLLQLERKPVAQPFSQAIMSHVCGKQGSAGCHEAIANALKKTYDQLVQANGGRTDVGRWTQNAATQTAKQTMPQYDAIQFVGVGLVGQSPIDWQNRPTFQQVVEFESHR
jgi:acyl-homoserine lactone acylase PvdQ